MTDEERQAINYRFGGYQLPMIQLDSTGPAYYVVQPHPYYQNQPSYWSHPFYYGHPGGADNMTPAAGERGTLYPFLQNDPET